MIALVSFDEIKVMLREEAEELGLTYQDHDQFGIKDGKIHPMNDSYGEEYYEDEVEEKEGKYYKNGKQIPNWDVYRRPKQLKDWVVVRKENHLVDLSKMAKKCKHKFYIEKAIETEEPSINNIKTVLADVEDKARRVENVIDTLKQETFNEKTNVHVGGGLITTYNELTVIDDACADLIQEQLNDGWRIIAVCIQNDQRRPDYILGRFNPSLDVSTTKEARRVESAM